MIFVIARAERSAPKNATKFLAAARTCIEATPPRRTRNIAYEMSESVTETKPLRLSGALEDP